MENSLRLIDQIEQLVENGKGWMGKRVVNELEFFTLIQQLRVALPQAMKDAPPTPMILPSVATKTVELLIEETRLLTDKEQLQVLVALATQLAQKQP